LALKKCVDFGYGDSLDAFSVHRAGVTPAAILTGAFPGNRRPVRRPQARVAMAGTISIPAPLIILSVIDKLIGLRVRQQHERVELDLLTHGQERYAWEVG
jgi:Amt family ammonium transporter